MSNQDQQEEEREVLLSIYEGDSNFFDISTTLYQYKIGADGASKSAIVEVSWGENYPENLPTINLDIFYNKHLIPEVKDTIKNTLLAEAEHLLGYGSTYTLFEYAKENTDELLQPQIRKPVAKKAKDPEPRTVDVEGSKGQKQKKEQLSKNQKRRLYDKFGTQGMMDGKQRGWDWVDLIKHLNQTGSKADGQ